MLLTRKQILEAHDVRSEVVDVPEWAEGGQVRVRGLSAAQRVKIAQRAMTDTGQIDNTQALDLLVLIPALCIIDAEGCPVFGEGDVQDLGDKSGAPLQRIMEAALRLSDMDVDDLKKV